MKQFEGALCAACLISGEYAECTVCPMRVGDTERKDDVVTAERTFEGMSRWQDCRHRDEKQRHQTMAVTLSFPADFRAKIKGSSINDLIKLFEGWKEMRYADKELITDCTAAIEKLQVARQYGGFSKGTWWKGKGNLRVTLEFSNYASLVLFKEKMAA